MKFFDEKNTSIIALGGLEEIGKNMFVIMHKSEIIIIDAGVKFPEDELLGIDYVIQDVSFLKQHENKIKGLLITHGHEDHIGGISFLLQHVNVPVIYAPRIAADLITNKLEDRNIKYDNLEIITSESIVKTKYFEVEFISMTHSIPDCFGLAVKTPNGTIMHTGDFKFDLTPIGPMFDLYKLAKYGDEGVRLLLSDSTNALSEGFSKSESIVDEALGNIISQHLGRIILATFASNMYRVKHIVETCKKNNRKILVFGRSMENNIKVALKNGLLDDPTMFIEPNQAKDYKNNQICILCTGSQGEPLAALSRIANGSHRQIKLLPDDLVVFSSSPIPGNAEAINRVINKLYLKGVRVYTNHELADIHTSGHAKADELRLLFRLVKPDYFMPIHGEYRMLKGAVDLAVECDVKRENTFVLKNGDVLSLTPDKKVIYAGEVPGGDVYVDGSRVGDVGSTVIKDRKLMSKDGILMTILNINPLTRKLLLKPNVTTRGFVLVNESLGLIQEIEKKVDSIVKDALSKGPYNYVDIKNQIILELNPFINEKTGRRPIIFPVIMEVRETVTN